jgi:hypothetical protein
VLAPATLAALPSTRAIPDRDVFYVARPARSILLSYFLVCPNFLIPNSSFLLLIAPCTPRKVSQTRSKRSSGNHEAKKDLQNVIQFSGLKLARLPPSLAATLAALPSISETPFLDSWLPDKDHVYKSVPAFLGDYTLSTS